MAELKKCPFCGTTKQEEVFESLEIQAYDNDDGSETYWYVFCNGCGANGAVRKSEQEAIDAWNKRSK